MFDLYAKLEDLMGVVSIQSSIIVQRSSMAPDVHQCPRYVEKKKSENM